MNAISRMLGKLAAYLDLSKVLTALALGLVPWITSYVRDNASTTATVLHAYSYAALDLFWKELVSLVLAGVMARWVWTRYQASDHDVVLFSKERRHRRTELWMSGVLMTAAWCAAGVQLMFYCEAKGKQIGHYQNHLIQYADQAILEGSYGRALSALQTGKTLFDAELYAARITHVEDLLNAAGVISELAVRLPMNPTYTQGLREMSETLGLVQESGIRIAIGDREAKHAGQRKQYLDAVSLVKNGDKVQAAARLVELKEAGYTGTGEALLAELKAPATTGSRAACYQEVVAEMPLDLFVEETDRAAWHDDELADEVTTPSRTVESSKGVPPFVDDDDANKFLYITQTGDTFFSIAAMFRVSAEKLAMLNVDVGADEDVELVRPDGTLEAPLYMQLPLSPAGGEPSNQETNAPQNEGLSPPGDEITPPNEILPPLRTPIYRPPNIKTKPAAPTSHAQPSDYQPPPEPSAVRMKPEATLDNNGILMGTRLKRGRVKSPYPPHAELDVTDLPSGSLALDPASNKVFEVP
jgi:hypothetical protein